MEKFKQEKEELLRVGGVSGPKYNCFLLFFFLLYSQNKKFERAMRVCDVCGAYLVSTDSDKRVQAHLEGS
jgi:hypothetical protein